MTRRLLQPLSALSEATRKIGEGNFDTRAHVRGNDELAGLARDFNAMAVRLTEYRKSSLGELLQAHLSMQAAIDSLPDPVAIFGVEGNLQNVNQAAESLLGLRTDGGKNHSRRSMRRLEPCSSGCAATCCRAKARLTRADSKTRCNFQRFWATAISCRAPRRSTSRAA